MIPRHEHPKPQAQRENWLNLNGEWQFEIDHGNSGAARGLFRDGAEYSMKINVPFCPQSELSGIGYKDFMASVWYKRELEVTSDMLKGRVFLHFGAVDYKATLYVNEKLVGTHVGGYVSFKFDITDYVNEGSNLIVLHAEDDERSRLIPSGKQCDDYYSRGCHYTRTTGIWQTVWVEFCPNTYIESFKLYPNLQNKSVTVMAKLVGKGEFKVAADFENAYCGENSVKCEGGQAIVTVALTETHIWEVGAGGLYGLTLTYGEDTVSSYFGLRSIEYIGNKFYLNGRSVFQRLILDQGFYPDGIYTAPTDAALERDIDLSMAMGFNGARLHEKIFEERFLYHADRKGYLVWAEYPNWGLDHTYEDAIYSMLPEWLEEMERDFNHPSIVGWCPFNETWDIRGRKQYDPLLVLVYNATKAVDPYRPCIDVSGGYHVVTDVFDVHDYDQNPEILKSHFHDERGKGFASNGLGKRQIRYDGKSPFFVSEYGGIRWSNKDGWGYGDAPKTEEEYLTRLKALTDVLLDDPEIFAYCYTQLTDVEQEQNGLYYYDRTPKFPSEVIYPIFAKKAAIED